MCAIAIYFIRYSNCLDVSIFHCVLFSLSTYAKLERTIKTLKIHGQNTVAVMQNGQPVAYASRAIMSAETQYAQIKKELLAIVFCSETF